MRKFLTLFLLLVASLGVKGQSFSRADYPSLGDSAFYVKADTTGVLAGAGGTGLAWNFSNMVQGPGTAKVWYRNRTATPNGASFPIADMAYIDSDGNYKYLRDSANKIWLYGDRSVGNTVIKMRDAGALFQFPFNYGDTLRDSIFGVFPDPFLASPVYHRGKITTIFDGTGSLVTPFANYASAKRIYQEIAYLDSATAAALISNIYIFSWYWYEDGNPMPVMKIQNQAVIINGGSPQLSKDVWYSTQFPVAVNDPLEIGLSVSPNPAHDQAIVAFQLNSVQQVEMSLVNVLGASVWKMPKTAKEAGYHQISLDLSGYDAGTYFLEIKTEKGRISKTLVLQ